MRLIHIPTGLSRAHPGPLRNVDRNALMQRCLAEIESELEDQGLLQHIVPEYRTKAAPRRRRH